MPFNLDISKQSSTFQDDNLVLAIFFVVQIASGSCAVLLLLCAVSYISFNSNSIVICTPVHMTQLASELYAKAKCIPSRIWYPHNVSALWLYKLLSDFEND